MTTLTTGLFAGVPKPVMHTTKFDIVLTFISHTGYRRSCFSSVVIWAICRMIIQSMFSDSNYRNVSIFCNHNNLTKDWISKWFLTNYANTSSIRVSSSHRMRIEVHISIVIYTTSFRIILPRPRDWKIGFSVERYCVYHCIRAFSCIGQVI